MRFIDYLPELSLSFIIWITPGVIFAFAMWLIIFLLLKICRKLSINIGFEHVTMWLILFVLAFILRIIFLKTLHFIPFPLNSLLLVGILFAVIIWFGYKFIEKILYWFDDRITPLVWLIALSLIIAIPFSFVSIIKKEPPTATYFQGSDTSPDKTRPNIILVIWDTLTARNMQLYGYDRPTTPFISEWAKDATVFQRAYAASNWTTPSVMSLFTGQRVWTHRVWYNAYFSPLKDYKQNIAKLLRDNGYNIYGFVQNQYAHPDNIGIGGNFITKDHPHTFRFLSGSVLVNKLSGFVIERSILKKFLQKYFLFDLENYVQRLLEMSKKPKKDKKVSKRQTKPNKKSFRDMETSFHTTFPPENVYNRFLSLISEDKVKQPYFALVYAHPPHDPYRPPKPYLSKFGDTKRFPGLKSGITIGVYEPRMQKRADYLEERYDEFILYCDEQFRLFIDQISQNLDLSNTIIIFASDHGESFYHGYNGHKHGQLYEQVMHIPLIFKIPGNNNGNKVNMPAGIIDIAPTILELSGIPIPAWMEGRSLLPLIKGESMQSRPVFGTYLEKNRSFGNPITKGLVAVWDGEYKLIHNLSKNDSMLFHLPSDPDENNNIYHSNPEIAKPLLKLINDNLSMANQSIIQSRNN